METARSKIEERLLFTCQRTSYWSGSLLFGFRQSLKLWLILLMPKFWEFSSQLLSFKTIWFTSTLMNDTLRYFSMIKQLLKFAVTNWIWVFLSLYTTDSMAPVSTLHDLFCTLQWTSNIMENFFKNMYIDTANRFYFLRTL